MNVDEHLAKFVPVAPGTALRGRVLEACRRRSRERRRAPRFWVSAAALLLVLFAGNQWLEQRTRRLFTAPYPTPSEERPVGFGVGFGVGSAPPLAWRGASRAHGSNDSWLERRRALMEADQWE